MVFFFHSVQHTHTHTHAQTNAISHLQRHAMSKACLLPVLLRITRLFYLEIPAAPLDAVVAMERAPRFSVSIRLSPLNSITPYPIAMPLAHNNNNRNTQKSKLFRNISAKPVSLLHFTSIEGKKNMMFWYEHWGPHTFKWAQIYTYILCNSLSAAGLSRNHVQLLDHGHIS